MDAPQKPNPIAALIRQGAEDAGRRQGKSRAVTKVQRMINSLQWRQAHSKDEFYPLALESGAVLKIRQLQAGEVTGLGTGATVWPAAHVLAKYLEGRFGEGGLKGCRVVDLGSGTGVTGIVAAALGAEAFLTDQEQLLFLMRENSQRWAHDARRRVSPPKTDALRRELGTIRVLAYDWGEEHDGLRPPMDVIIVSDCVLPKLYPIEPLVAAIDRLSGPDTVTIMSYEHRHYQEFDPRRKFEELAKARNLDKLIVPQAEQHPIFSADDIEVWEVRRRLAPPSEAGSKSSPRVMTLNPGKYLAEADRVNETTVTIYSQSPNTNTDSSTGWDKTTVASVQILGELHDVVQAPSGAIGCYLWPSSLVMARHIVAATAGGRPSQGSGGSSSKATFSSSLYPPHAKVLELGSGVGLVAMTAALVGWNVLATDRADALPLLAANVQRCLESTHRSCVSAVNVMEYEWGSQLRAVTPKRPCSNDETLYDVVICADCVYAKSSIEPLLTTLCQVCDCSTIVLITNELRSAFDEFLHVAGGHFWIEDVRVLEDDMVVDAKTNERPKPVALKRLRLRDEPL